MNTNICFICGREFPTKDLVVKHIKRKHSDWLGTEAYLNYLKEPKTEIKIDTSFKKKLMKIDGIAKKTSEDIANDFPTEELLRLAIKNNKRLSYRDDIVSKLKKVFKFDK